MKAGASRGFTLIETVVALAIFSVLCLFTLRVVTGVLHWSLTQASRDTDAAAVDALADRWTADADSAWAVFTPPADVNGASNADGHEVDFFTRDGKNRSYFWSYTYDKAAQTLTRFRYAAPGGSPVKDQTFGGVTAFVAQTYPVTALKDSSTPVYSPLYAGAVLQPGSVRFYPTTAPWIDGGNQITYVRVETASQVREMQLATQSAPSGFTIVLQYTPAPSATPATGPLITLGKIVFEPGSLSYNEPAQRLARGLNAVLGGGVAQASGTCAYAQLYLQDGSTDANSEDGFNATDGNGCVTDGSVRLWAKESGYTGMFYYANPASGGCRNYLSLSPPSWQINGYTTVTPLSAISSCTVQVQSADKTLFNGGAASVQAAVKTAPCTSGLICYSILTTTREQYLMKCQGGGSLGPPCAGGGSWLWRDAYSISQYSSVDGGNTWSDLGPSYDCTAPMAFTNSGPAPGGTSCAPPRLVSPTAYTGAADSWVNMQTARLSSVSNWSPSTPPTIP